MAKSYEKRLLLFEIEVTEGTDPVPVVAADAITARNFNPGNFQGNQFIRQIDGQFFGARPSITTGITKPVTFEIEMTGSGTANTPPNWMKLLRPCGFDAGVAGGSSVVQTPISSAVPSATIYGFLDDLLLPCSGVRGTATLTVEDDAIPFFGFSMTGIPPSSFVSEDVPGTPTFANTSAPVIANSANTTFSLGGYEAPLRRLTIDLGVDVQLRSLIGPSDTMAFRNRAISGSALIELPDLTDKNYFTSINGSQVALEVTHGTVAGSIVEIASSTAEVGLITTSEEQGQVMATVPLRFIPTAAGNDELIITTS
jgi:hypothetical protein